MNSTQTTNSELFRDSVNKDVQMYLDEYKDKAGSVLIFPPVDNYKRFLIHNSIENFDDLCSFSIGHGDGRRTVISNKEYVTRPATDSSKSVEQQRTRAIIPTRERSNDKRRPDRPVYVPKVRSSTKTSTLVTSPTEEVDQSIEKESLEMLKRVDKASKSPEKAERSSPKKSVANAKEEEEDDWDSMFADDGECLNPDMMKELTAAVQNVHIVPAPAVATVVQAEDKAVADEFSHVVEVSNFPAEFKTQDLMMLFMEYKASGFEVKWVDDTHALVIFSSSKIASQVVANKYPGVRLKRLSEASAESKGRAKRSGATMQPYKARPETCASLARRLVTGALGVKSTASKETLANERRILREAKEKKLLAKKEQKDIWDDEGDAAS